MEPRSYAVRHLSLTLNLLYLVQGGRKVFEGVCSNTTLTTLNLSNNELGSETVAAFCEALKSEDCQLEVVDLSGNRLTVDDAETIKNALSENETLSSLDLRNNPVSFSSICVYIL